MIRKKIFGNVTTMATSMYGTNNFPNISTSKRCNIKINTNILLGFPDEIIAEEYRKDVDFTTSKIGGQPVSTKN